MLTLFLPDLELTERVGVGGHVSVVDGLVDEGAQLAEVLGHGVHSLSLLPQPSLEVLQECIGQVCKVQAGPELLQLGDGGQQVFLGVRPLVGGGYGRPGECREGDGCRCLLLHGALSSMACGWLMTCAVDFSQFSGRR